MTYLDTVAYLDKIFKPFSYDPTTGHLRRATPQGPRLVGSGRVSVQGKLYWAHNIAWFLMFGELPERRLRHINRKSFDIRLCNLEMRPKRRSE